MRSRVVRVLGLVALAAALAGCGSSGSGSPSIPTVAPAKTFHLAGFTPSGPVRANHPTVFSFHIVLPSGKTLTDFRKGSGPHTGVHLIIVRDDLAVIVHRHPKIQPDGTVRDSVVLPKPGRYHVLVDIYPIIPATPQFVNFQLHASATVAGAFKAVPLPAYHPEITVSGYKVRIEKTSRITALHPAFVTIKITDAKGRSPHLQPWFGALAHAIFFRQGTLAYFHTHICAPGAPGCGALIGGRALTGTGSPSGLLHIGILLPQSGTWRLFLQFQVHGTVRTAPFTLRVH